ncbi:MAG: leucine-rich repeat domain-containing protein, partial [Clostridia bacterium]|nr:leucine-rich repeat domain-containing protein [Clostridia bacterium]
GSSVQIPSVMPNQSIVYYAQFAKAYTVTYDINLEGVTHNEIQADKGKAGATIALKDGAAFGVNGYMFLGWTVEKSANFAFGGGSHEGQYEANAELTLGETNVTLYAQWAKKYTSAKDKTSECVCIYEPLIGHGIGAAIRVCNGKENKLGFAEIDEQSGVLTFTFMYDEADGGDVEGRIVEGNTYVLRDEILGSYLMYDYVAQSPAEFILTTDGYGFATITRMVGSQTSALAFGKYEYDEKYEDYLFVSLDPETQEADNEYVFNFICDHQTVANTEFNGYFRQQGYESGSYLLYLNGSLYNYRLDLNGYGGARLYAYDAISEQTTLESSGVYRGTSNYLDETGEWEYLPSTGAGFRFILNTLSDPSGDITVYIEYDAETNLTLTEKDGSATLYLDGYGDALYTAGGEEYVGNFVISESHALITFVPYVSDGNGGMTAGGKMYFNVVWADGTFTVNTTGFVIDGTVLTSYEGEARVVVIPSEITEIADNAFNYTHTEVSLISVTIPAGVTKIGSLAFQNSYTLERATFLSETPVEIDWSTANNPFRWPSGTFIIVVPEGSQDAYKAAWTDCPYAIKGSVEVTMLAEFEVEEGVLVRYNKQPDAPDILDLTIPDGVTEIADNVFRGLEYIRSVDLNNVTKVGAAAFENCVNLKKVLFTNVRELGDAAFAGCYNLAFGAEYGDGTIVLPQIVTIGANAFRSCESLKLVQLGGNIESIGDTAFSECYIYEEEETLCLELLGEVPPRMGASIGLGNISMRIIVRDMEVAKKCYTAATWNKYCRHLYIRSGDEKGVYMDGSDTLELDGRAIFMTMEVMLYEISGSDITFYLYDNETATYSVISGNISADTITVTIAGHNYRFVKVVGDVTYTSTDGKYTIVCNPRVFDPTTYENTGYSGTATVLFNGAEATLRISGFNSKTITEFKDTDGKVYNFVITLDGTTFTYEKVRNERILGITCEDGSVLNIYFAGNSIYVYGELKIATGTGSDTLPAWSQDSTLAQNPSEGVYEFTRPYRSTTYKITVTLSEDGKTFTYTYSII